MTAQFIDPEVVEAVLRECLEDFEVAPDHYTAWEQEFLEGLEDYLEENACTDRQWTKLSEIAERHGL